MPSKWTLVTEKDPPYNRNVLITFEWRGKREVSVAFLEKSENWGRDSENDYDYIWREVSTPCLPPDAEIIAWMPMPKPYEESEDKENAESN